MADEDYGYGDSEDYGYGDSSPEEYGYGDSSPDEYGYEDSGPSEPVPKAEPIDRRPKRRCSVTKFNLDDDSALTAADRIRDMRAGADSCNDEQPIPSSSGYKSDDPAQDDKDDDEVEEALEKAPPSKKDVKKKGALSRLRKRLSVAF